MMRPTSACTVARCSEPRGLDFDGGGEVGVLDLLVAFECDAVEHGRFGQMHDKPLAGAFDGDLVEQARCDQRFQRRVARGVVETPVGRRMKVGAHGLGVDAAIAFDNDRCLRPRGDFGDDRCRENQPEGAGKPAVRFALRWRACV